MLDFLIWFLTVDACPQCAKVQAMLPFVPLISAVVGVGSTVYAASQQRKAAKQTQQIVQAAPTPQTLEAPPVMPTADDAAVQAARRRSLAEQVRRRGRASTILTSEEPLGGGY